MPNVDVNRGLRRDNGGNMLWDVVDVAIETDFGPYLERRVVGQPSGGTIHRVGPGGMMIYMYNDDPGVFYNEHGGRVSNAIAAQANFDVETLAKLHRRKLAMEKATDAVDQEWSEQRSSARVLAEKGEYRLVELGKGHCQVQFIEADGQGSPLSASMAPPAARKLFDDLVLSDEEVGAAAAPV